MKEVIVSIFLVVLLTACTTNDQVKKEHFLIDYYNSVIPDSLEYKVKNQIDSVIRIDKDPAILTYAWYLNGRHHYKSRRYENAFRSWNYAIQYHEEAHLNDLGILISLYKNVGVIYKRNGYTEDAVACYQEALKIAKAKGDQNQELSIGYNMGNALSLDKSDTVPTIYFESLKLARKLDNKKKIVQINMKLGNRLSDVGEYHEGESRLQEALRISSKDPSLSYYYKLVNQNLGHCLLQQSRFKEAKSYFDLAYSLPDPFMSTALDLGTLELALGDTLMAISYWKHAAQIYENKPSPTPEKFVVYELLANYDVEENKIKHLEKHLLASNEYHQTLKTLENIAEDPNKNFIVRYKDERNEFLAEIKRQYYLNLGIAIGIVLLIGGGIIWYFQRQASTKRKKGIESASEIVDQIIRIGK